MSDVIQQITSHLKITLNPMQESALKTIPAKDEIILLSPTGSGKTLAFLLPAVLAINPRIPKVQVLVVAPSRELAIQIEQVFKSMQTGFKVNSAYGGHSMKIEKQNLHEPPMVLIGTPGRIADHIDRGTFDLSSLHTIILDEFDKSLEFGFSKEMGFILRKLTEVKKKILTSATRMEEIPTFTKIKSPVTLDFIQDAKPIALSLKKIISPERDKLKTLLDLLCFTGDESTLVFVNHREPTERISEYLNENGIINDAFHGGMEQTDREKILAKFRNGSSKLLITTDLASRGLDIPEIKYIIHYHLPSTEDAFTHRNGRTARMNAKGTAFVIVSDGEELPPYFDLSTPVFGLGKNLEKPRVPEWETLYIGGGKKDKINKIDIVGFLSKQANLEKDDIGLIEVKDFFAYAAVKRKKMKSILQAIQGEKIKNKKVKFDVVR
ncbi:MAG TPA: DEAD/DEAH box helicase [Flavobacteriales bacterium]|nr:DEAD/DEAH box helicase [Flavobacteriales bacterium]